MNQTSAFRRASSKSLSPTNGNLMFLDVVEIEQQIQFSSLEREAISIFAEKNDIFCLKFFWHLRSLELLICVGCLTCFKALQMAMHKPLENAYALIPKKSKPTFRQTLLTYAYQTLRSLQYNALKTLITSFKLLLFPIGFTDRVNQALFSQKFSVETFS